MKFTNKVFLIDGNSYIHRAYHAIPLLTTSFGVPINAVFGFVRMIFKILKNFKPEYFCICFDSDKPTFRHEIYKEYKATRKKLDNELKVQFPIVKEFVTIAELPHVLVNGYEADDIIACLSNKFKKEHDIVIVSGDKDILQLVDDKVVVYNEHKDMWYDVKAVKEKYNVLPNQLIDYFCLVGDKIDNISGVPGIGPKTAVQMLGRYNSIDGIYNNISTIEPILQKKFLSNKQLLYQYRQLITLKSEIAELEEFSLEKIRLSNINVVKIKEFLFKYELKSILKELDKLPYDDVKEEAPLFFHLSQIRQSFNNENGEDFYFINNKEQLNTIQKNLKNSQLFTFLIYSNEIKDVVGQIGQLKATTGEYKFYIPLIKHIKDNNEEILPLAKNNFINFLDLLFYEKSLTVVSYDIKFQLKKIYEIFNIQKYDLDNIVDILILSHLIVPNKKISCLQDLVNLWLDIKPISENILPVGFRIDLFPIEKFVNRLFDSVTAIKKIYENLQEKLTPDILEVYKNIELPMVNVLIKMEKNGILVDKEYLKNLKLTIEEEIKKLKDKIFENASTEFNLNSPKQLSFILFEKLKLPPIKKKKTGYSTDEEVLKKLKGIHPIIELILRYRELEKLKNTYLEPIESYINPNTSRVHTTFNLTGTSTGRLSSEGPNMQNIPVKTENGKKIRNIFVAEKNYKLVSLDYSQIELRILAHFSEDNNLMNAFFENKDVHKITAMEIFGLNEEQITEDLRRIAKVINFGIIYGMSPQGLAKELSIDVTVSEEFISKYFKKYNKVKEWIEYTINFAKKNGYAKTLFGRIRPIPEINSTNKQLVSFGERLAINTPIQGTAADIIKLAMIKINEYIDEEMLNDKIKMLLQIHDELLFEIHESVLEESISKIKYIMENVIKLKVPLIVDIKISERWEG